MEFFVEPERCIRAVQWTGSNLSEVKSLCDFAKKKWGKRTRTKVRGRRLTIFQNFCWDTEPDECHVGIGDWIILHPPECQIECRSSLWDRDDKCALAIVSDDDDESILSYLKDGDNIKAIILGKDSKLT